MNNLIVCPKCKQNLEKVDRGYHCEKCSQIYPTTSDISNFLIAENTDSFNEFWDEGWKKRTNDIKDQALFINSTKEILENFLDTNINKLMLSQHPIADVIPVFNKTILNVGCGIGEAPNFARFGANRYIGIDYSYTAAKISLDNLRKLDSPGIIVQANAEKLPIRSDSIDLVYSNGVLHHTPNTDVAIGEIYRVLRQNGKAVIGLYNTFSPLFIQNRVKGEIKKYFSNTNSWYEIDEADWATSGLANPWTRTYSVANVKSILSNYKIDNIKIRKHGFMWSHLFHKLGAYIDSLSKEHFFCNYLQNYLGAMLVITFNKSQIKE